MNTNNNILLQGRAVSTAVDGKQQLNQVHVEIRKKTTFGEVKVR